jgi:integrase
MSLFQRGKVWYYLFYVNGKRFRGSTKRKNLKQATRIYAHARVRAEAGESLKPQRAPVIQDFVPRFLEWVDKGMLEPNTKADYRNGCRLILKSGLLGMRLDQITRDDIEITKFHDSPYSTNCALRTLSRLLGKARDWKLIREVPRVKKAKVYPRDRMVTKADEKELLPASPHPLRDVLIIMLDGGMRNGEVVRMRWEYVNWEATFYFNPKGKTRKARRVIPLSERVINLLTGLRKQEQGEGWVFPSNKSRSGHIELSGLEHMFRKVARRLGMPESLKLYCARHTFGTVAMAETRNPGLVKDVMGHESLATTMGYLHPDVLQIKTVIDRRNQEKGE